MTGTEGYAEQAAELFDRYESLRAADVHRPVLHLIPAVPSRVLDIGAGSGRDAAWLAAKGHRVIAVEPTAALRLPAMARHRSDRNRMGRRQPAGSRPAAKPGRPLRSRHAHRGLDASRCARAASGDAKSRHAGARRRHHAHDAPARTRSAGTSHVRCPRRRNHRARRAAPAALRAEPARGIKSPGQPRRGRRLDQACLCQECAA